VTKNQINHIMIQNKQKGCIKNFRSFIGADADLEIYKSTKRKPGLMNGGIYPLIPLFRRLIDTAIRHQ